MPKKKSRRERMAESSARPAAETRVPAREESAPAAQGKPAEKPKAPAKSAAAKAPKWMTWGVPLGMFGFLMATSLMGGGAAKGTALALIAAAVGSCLYRLSCIRERMNLATVSVCLWLLMNGLSMIYAVSGSFALRAFLYLAAGFSVLLLILAWSRRGEGTGRTAGTILAGGTALASLISIDMLSTHFLSGPFIAFVGTFTTGNVGLGTNPVEEGVRMLSIYQNPNAFAGVAGLGVLLGLGLAVTAENTGERRLHQVCLFVNALAFVLAFSMGASGMIAVAFLVLLISERRERKARLFLLMVETLMLTMVCVFPIFLTSFDTWDGVQPIPLLCALGGSAALCALDELVGRRLGEALAQRGKALAAAIGGMVVLLAAFAAAAVTLTGPANLAGGDVLRRAAYPEPGLYAMDISASASGGVEMGPDSFQVTIQSQNQQDTMMHTFTTLYKGNAQGAQFTVPEDSMVVYFNFRSKDGAERTLREVRYEHIQQEVGYTGDGSEKTLPLEYKLLPGFIANRLQGLFANQNAIQRTVFFSDGMKLFRRSPVIGLGIGAFENAILGVQSFFYETKYAHNHYVETLVTTGAVGLGLFLLMLGTMALALLKNLRRKEEAHPLAPALLAALVFMAAHAGVEIVFSFCFYLPMALGVFGLICLCAGPELPLPGGEKAGAGLAAATCVLLSVFAVLLYLNMSMARMISNRDYRDPFQALDKAARLDRFEWTTYTLSYVYAVKDMEASDPGSTDPAVLARADEHALRLARVDSNTIPRHLAEYYFVTGRPEQAVEMLEKYIDYTAADSRTWQQAFAILQTYWSVDLDLVRSETAKLYSELQTWNEEHMGTLTLSQENLDFIRVMAAE